jgi:hypothetical protein
MELSCNRCHNAILAENSYCPVCGLPQLVYEAADGVQGQPQPEHWDGAVRDADSIDWKPALRAALLLAIPAGILSSGVSPLGALGILWIALAAAWAVVIYLRGKQIPWITVGAGVRIGLITGLLTDWIAFGVSGCALFLERFLLHRSGQIEAEWKAYVEASQQLAAQMGITDSVQMQAQKALMLSPEGHAGFAIFGILFNEVFLLIFAIAGGALAARIMGRTRLPEP